MKTLASQLIFFFHHKTARRNFAMLWKFFSFLFFIICLYSVLFHVLMIYEGRDFSWITGFYWTMTVMSTLGFGDITFHSDLGLLFTMLVLFSGVLFLLIMLPFIFIQFFYSPWLEAQQRAKIPRLLPEHINNHVILTSHDPISTRLIDRLAKYDIPYALVTPDHQLANELHDLGYLVVIGEPDKPSTYEALRIADASLVVVTNDDLISTNICFTIREVDRVVPIVTNADTEHSIDILEFSGNTSVFQFTNLLGTQLAKRTQGVSMTANIIGRFEELMITEMPVKESELVGKTLLEANIRSLTGVTVIGLMQKGRFSPSAPNMIITKDTILVLSGTVNQLKSFEDCFGVDCCGPDETNHVLILGGGRVGLSAGRTLSEHGINYRIVEKRPLKVTYQDEEHFIIGDAADINTLEAAGIKTARSVIVTTHSDDMNIYLTFYCRQLRPDIQIISRSILERNVSKLHSAGADQVMSYASLGAGTIFQLLRPSEVSLFTEGLIVFNRKAGTYLHGRSIMESGVRDKTGCNIVALRRNGRLLVSPEPETILETNDELILIGTADNEELFLRLTQ